MWRVNKNVFSDTETGWGFVAVSPGAIPPLAEFVAMATSSLIRIYCLNEKCRDRGCWVDRGKEVIESLINTCDTCGKSMSLPPSPIKNFQVKELTIGIEFSNGEIHAYRSNGDFATSWLANLIESFTKITVKLYCRNEKCSGCGGWIERTSKMAREVEFFCDTCGGPMVVDSNAQTTKDST